MKFEEIFKQKGLYKSDSFQSGVALEIREDGVNNNLTLYTVTYKDKDDLLPERVPTIVYDNLFKKDYKKVFTIKSLFN